MDIISVPINQVKPYKYNPRRNDAAVEGVAASIKRFGFKVPIIIDKDNVIVAGHTRLKAAKKLGLKEVPCIMADDLDEEELRAFRLADNKVAEAATWDMGLLQAELNDILSIDMEEFGFEFLEEESDDDGYYGDERERTYDSYNLYEFDWENAEGFYQMPILEPCDVVPDDIISFNYMLTAKRTDVGIHFYCDDYQFERMWNQPGDYLEKLKKFQCVFTPDFSLYLDMPMAMKIWNVYRSRLVGQIMQRAGIPVIPTVSWAEPDTFEFAFDGLPEDATLSVSTIGVKRDPTATEIWTAGMNEMIERKSPKRLLVYGGELEYDYGGIEVIYYNNITVDRMSGKET